MDRLPLARSKEVRQKWLEETRKALNQPQGIGMSRCGDQPCPCGEEPKFEDFMEDFNPGKINPEAFPWCHIHKCDAHPDNGCDACNQEYEERQGR